MRARSARLSSRLKTRENVVVLDFLAVDNFDFTRKYCQNVKNSLKCCDFVKMEFLDKNLTFRIQCDYVNVIE